MRREKGTGEGAVVSKRGEARKRGNFGRKLRIVVVCSVFVLGGYGIFVGVSNWVGKMEEGIATEGEVEEENVVSPTVEVYDEDAGITGGTISTRMSEWIGQVEADLKELGYTPVKAVLPTGTVREVDFYLENVAGYIKMTIDRGSGVSAEDADRMIRYLKGIGVTEFSYIDVRVEGKGFWK